MLFLGLHLKTYMLIHQYVTSSKLWRYNDLFSFCEESYFSISHHQSLLKSHFQYCYRHTNQAFNTTSLFVCDIPVEAPEPASETSRLMPWKNLPRASGNPHSLG